MENNSRLNYIKTLIREGYADGKLTDTDLEEIKDFIDHLKSNKPNPTNDMDKSTSSEIPQIKATNYNTNFNRHFSEDNQLNKTFQLESKLFDDALDNKESIVIRLVEVSETFRLVYINNNNHLLINNDGNGFDPMNSEDYNQYKKDFDKGIGQKLDDNLEFMSNGYKKDNTRKLTMFHYGNFDDAVARGKDFKIKLKPAIIDDHSDPNYLQFTFVMELTTVINEKIVIISETKYYDTFQLCPPNC
jgi:hypothetical protein